MLKRESRTDKILLLGVDGMDPRLTKKYVDKGLMPNVKKYIEHGAARKDLVMLGGHPTVTPPMWTTLATGCYANVHGITGYFRSGKEIGSIEYNMDSRNCKAEPLWNAFAEAGKRTLVWHWPGCGWPPTSENDNLFVVDSTSPGSVANAVAQVESEFLVGASAKIETLSYQNAAASDAATACVVQDLDLDKQTEAMELNQSLDVDTFTSLDLSTTFIVYKESQMEHAATENAVDLVQSPIKPATGWANAPKDAKEFTILLSKGFIRRPALILKNDMGIYDTIAIFKSKQDNEPLAICPLGKMIVGIVDEAIKNDVKYEKANRNFKLLKISEDGDELILYVSAAMDTTNDSVYSPKRLYDEIVDNVGFPPPTSYLGQQNSMLITDCMLDSWNVCADWQADAILHLIKAENIDVVFSHFHNVDNQAHEFIKHLADREFNRNPVSVAEKWMEDLYVQTDRYLGKFLHLLDEDWTIIIMSDHGQVASKYSVPMIIEPSGLITPIMEELGYTSVIRDEHNEVIAIDWKKTTAITVREGQLYLNIAGRDKHLVDGIEIDGIVDPKDKYELEEQIMTDLYGLRSPITGHRIISLALRNKDAVLLGMGGPECGDICFWLTEGYNFDHADCISTTLGENDTSVSPIFIAAGKGLKKGYTTDRIIRQIDFAPTVAVLGGVRMPKNCEGAPVYQIFAEEV